MDSSDASLNPFGDEECVGYLLRRVLQSIMQSADVRLVEHGLTSAQWPPLFRMHKQGGTATVATLARDLQKDGGGMTRMLDRLEDKGFCRRLRSTQDRRVVLVSLTCEGEAAVSPVAEVLSGVLNDHLRDFSPAERQTLRGYILRMLENGEGLRN